MAIIKPFRGYLPLPDLAEKTACLPYDVLSSDEAREIAKDNSYSFLHVVKPEIDLPKETDPHDELVYKKALDNLQIFIQQGIFNQNQKECYYVYSQCMDGKTQYGLVAGAHIEDYENEVIKKHELTRPDKEEDRKKHVRVTNFNAAPVFFTYPDNEKIDAIISGVINTKPYIQIKTDDDIDHTIWIVDDEIKIQQITKIFKDEIPHTYIADGHHRTAAAALVGSEKKAANPNHTGNEEYNYFMAVHFPASQLQIIDYNRLVKDLNGFTTATLLEAIQQNFEIEKCGDKLCKPAKLHEINMFIDDACYHLKAKSHTYDDNDPIKALDVNVLSEYILDPILGIKDLRKSKRIDFVGGIRGMGELEKRVRSGEHKVAFALFPVSMQQLIDIANTGNIMPPKTTWFEPKLRSGLVLHELD